MPYQPYPWSCCKGSSLHVKEGPLKIFKTQQVALCLAVITQLLLHLGLSACASPVFVCLLGFWQNYWCPFQSAFQNHPEAFVWPSFLVFSLFFLALLSSASQHFLWLCLLSVVYPAISGGIFSLDSSVLCSVLWVGQKCEGHHNLDLSHLSASFCLMLNS